MNLILLSALPFEQVSKRPSPPPRRSPGQAPAGPQSQGQWGCGRRAGLSLSVSP